MKLYMDIWQYIIIESQKPKDFSQNNCWIPAFVLDHMLLVLIGNSVGIVQLTMRELKGRSLLVKVSSSFSDPFGSNSELLWKHLRNPGQHFHGTFQRAWAGNVKATTEGLWAGGDILFWGILWFKGIPRQKKRPYDGAYQKNKHNLWDIVIRNMRAVNFLHHTWDGS